MFQHYGFYCSLGPYHVPLIVGISHMSHGLNDCHPPYAGFSKWGVVCVGVLMNKP